MTIDEVKDTIRRMYRMQLARAWAHGKPVSKADIAEAMIALGEEALQGEQVILDCVELAAGVGRADVYDNMHRNPIADHEMIDEAIVYMEQQRLGGGGEGGGEDG